MVTVEEFLERICRLGARRGPRGFPRNPRDRQILMKSIVLGLDAERTYRQSEIDDALRAWKRDVAPAIETDHVTLRRLLVDHGQLERTADGSAYRVGFPAAGPVFDLAVYDVDVRAT